LPTNLAKRKISKSSIYSDLFKDKDKLDLFNDEGRTNKGKINET